jgi:hypothetical protein
VTSLATRNHLERRRKESASSKKLHTLSSWREQTKLINSAKERSSLGRRKKVHLEVNSRPTKSPRKSISKFGIPNHISPDYMRNEIRRRRQLQSSPTARETKAIYTSGVRNTSRGAASRVHRLPSINSGESLFKGL